MWSRVMLVALLALGCSGMSMGASVASAQSDASSDADARRYFEEARTAYDAGDFEGAVRGFRRAYVLSPRYALLYNIGQAELRAGHDALALESLEGFLRQAPDTDPRRSEVEERVRVLRSMGVRPASESEAQAAQQTAGEGVEATPPATTTTTTTTEASDANDGSGGGDSGPGIVPWIIVGVGGALLVTGAVLMGVGASDAGRVTSAPVGSRWTDLEGVASGAQTMWGVGIALLGVGVAAAAGGLVWALVGGGSSESSASAEPSGATAQLRLAPGALFFEGEF